MFISGSRPPVGSNPIVAEKALAALDDLRIGDTGGWVEGRQEDIGREEGVRVEMR